MMEPSATLDALRWMAHWPLANLSVLQERFKSWYNPGLQCVELTVMPKQDFAALLARSAGRPPLVPGHIADTMAETFADNEDQEISILEALSGLAMLCEGSQEAKLEFIFDLFDERDYGELVEDQVLALCTIASRAASRLGDFVPQASDREVARWVDRLFQDLHAANPEQRYARLHRDDFVRWVLSNQVLQHPLLLPECVYTFERLMARFHASVDNLPQAPTHLGGIPDFEQHDADDEPASDPVWIIQGPWVECQDDHMHVLVARVSRPDTRLTFAMSLIDLFFASELPNLVGYVPGSSWNRVFGRPCRADDQGYVRVALPGHLLPTGVRTRVTLDTLSGHRKETCFTPGPPRCVLVSVGSTAARSGPETLTPLDMHDIVIKVTRPPANDLEFEVSSGKLVVLHEQETVFRSMPLADSSALVILGCPARGPAHLHATKLRDELARAAASHAKRLFIVLDHDGPLLGRRRELLERDARRVNEEILFALAAWQQQAANRQVTLVLTQGHPAEAGWGTIIQNQAHGPSSGSSETKSTNATFAQVVLVGNYAWSEIAAQPVLETASLKEAFAFVPNDGLSRRAGSLAYFRTDEKHQVLAPTLTFGPAIARVTATEATLVLEVDRAGFITVDVVNMDESLHDTRVVRVEARHPVTIMLQGLWPDHAYRVNVLIGHRRLLAACDLVTAGASDAQAEIFVVNGASSELGRCDALLECVNDIPTGACVLHLGGWIPWHELGTLRTKQETREAIRFWLNARPALARLMQRTSTLISPPPLHTLHPACAKTLQEYFAPFQRPRNCTVVAAADSAKVGEALDALLFRSSVEAQPEAVIVALGSPMDPPRHQDAAEAMVRFAQAAARRGLQAADNLVLVHPCPRHAAAWTASITDRCSHLSFREMCVPPACLDIRAALISDDFASLPAATFGYEHRFHRDEPHAIVRGAPGWCAVFENRLASVPASQHPEPVRLAHDLRQVRDRIHEQEARMQNLEREQAQLSQNLATEASELDALVSRLKEKRLQLFDERLAELRELEARKKAYGQVTTLCLDAVESLKQYFQELPQVRAKVSAKEAPKVVREHSLACDTTQLVLRIANLCPEARTVLIEGANVLKTTGEIRLKNDGSYSFSEDLTKAAFTRISKLFVRKIAQLEKDDRASHAKFHKLLLRLHDLRGPTLVEVGERVDALRAKHAEVTQGIASLSTALAQDQASAHACLASLKVATLE